MALRAVASGLLLVLAACAREAPPPRQTEWQRALLRRLAGTSETQSRAASEALLERLDGADVRAELQVCSPEAAALPAAALAERLRREVRVAEVVSGFTAKGWPFRMSLKEAAEGPGYFENGWEVGARQGYNFSGGEGWYSIQDGIEMKLYGLRPFGRLGYPQSVREASERAPYCLVNLFRLDSGSQLYGDLSVVLSTDLAAGSSVVSGVDTGGWSALCNSTPRTRQGLLDARFPGWPPPGYKANCSAYRPFAGLGTLEHFDHLFLANEAYWNASIARVACRLLAPWGSYPVVGKDLFHYWEALPAAKLEYPSAIKFVIAVFDSLFGTALGLRAQRWCADNGWILVWSLGINNQSRANFWTAANLTWPLASNRRFADPLVLAKTSAGRNVSISSAAGLAFRTAWSEANTTRHAALAAGGGVANTTWSTAWTRLASALPAALRVAPLSADSCADAAACVGVAADGSCLCYQHEEAVELVV